VAIDDAKRIASGWRHHHPITVEGSLFPEDLGNDWVRPFRLQGDTLTLRLTGEDGLTRTLVFQRMR
jgi:hypothetical protein